MTGLFIFIHSVTCLLLLIIILMQSGRGGGLTETFASAESMFGAKTNEVLVKATTVLALLFLITSLTLAHLSAKRDRSLMADNMKKQATEQSLPTQGEGSVAPVAVPDAPVTPEAAK